MSMLLITITFSFICQFFLLISRNTVDFHILTYGSYYVTLHNRLLKSLVALNNTGCLTQVFIFPLNLYFGQSSVGITYLCTIPHQLEQLKGQQLNSSESVLFPMFSAWCSMLAETLGGCQLEFLHMASLCCLGFYVLGSKDKLCEEGKEAGQAILPFMKQSQRSYNFFSAFRSSKKLQGSTQDQEGLMGQILLLTAVCKVMEEEVAPEILLCFLANAICYMTFYPAVFLNSVILVAFFVDSLHF